MGFWNQFKKIFSTANSEQKKLTADSKIQNPAEEEVLLSHEQIKRSEEETKLFFKWTFSEKKSSILHWLNSEFSNYAENGCCDSNLMFLIIPSVNGFIINFNPDRWGREDFIYLFDYFKYNLKNHEDYFEQVSDIKIIKKENQIETTQRHYLKPPRQIQQSNDAKIDQKFGNLMISLTEVDNEIKMLKCSATYYSDRSYEKPLCFDKLIDILCK
jgi:hypothetical protein